MVEDLAAGALPADCARNLWKDLWTTASAPRSVGSPSGAGRLRRATDFLSRKDGLPLAKGRTSSRERTDFLSR
ncbi:hypothetical protein, partial [Miniimonas arenae]|uniref:hypothetical protein n=1 Tax=Miniimonas arenae TaxID=676201 RepID=UPI001C582033